MAKLTAPLLAFKAIGTIAGKITFTRVVSMPIAKHKPTPTDPKSAKQLIQRTRFQDCIATWNALTPAQKQTWMDNAKPLNQTAISLWLADCLPTTPPIEIERQIATSTDDCFVRKVSGVWTFDPTFHSVSVGYYNSSKSHYGAGMRFLNIPPPSGSTILQARFKIVASYTRINDVVRSKIRGELNATPITFSNLADYQARIRTTALTYWDEITHFTVGIEYTSPDFKSVIQEIIDLPGWNSGQPIVIFWDDHDNRTTGGDIRDRHGYSYDNAPALCAKLWLEYQPP